MKNHSFRVQILIFSSILLLFIVPSFLTPALSENTTLFLQWNFPLQQLIYGIIGGIIFYFFKEPYKKIYFLRFPVLLTIGLLLCSSLVMKFLSEVTGSINDYEVSLPVNVLQWIFCLLTFLFAAFFEEVIYRFYFIDALHLLLARKFTRKFIPLLCEAVGCLIFAFAHLYLGWLSVLNAVFGHIILRACYKKNQCLWPGVTAHFVYNIISLILL